MVREGLRRQTGEEQRLDGLISTATENIEVSLGLDHMQALVTEEDIQVLRRDRCGR